MQPIPTLLIGAGQRGSDVYGEWIHSHPDLLRLVGVVEPDPACRRRVAERFGLNPEQMWAGIGHVPAAVPATACIVATPDRTHHEIASWALARNYHVLLEKPMAATLSESVDLVHRSKQSRGSLSLAYVLRTTPFFRAVKQAVVDGSLGDIISISLRENVAAWHMAHSFVRGNWARAAESTPMIVAKSCHDFDVLAWIAPSPVRRLTSIGSLVEFRPERAPPGSTERCTDGCPVSDCPYDARRIYLERTGDGWPLTVLSHEASRAARLFALETGPYGRCVYRAQSDVVDHQAVVMELEDGADVTFTMQGHSHEETRTIRIDGTRATLTGSFGSPSWASVHDHRSGASQPLAVENAAGGHGGGDTGMIKNFVDTMRGQARPAADAQDALEGHLLAFMAEEARTQGVWINIDERREK